MKKYTDGMAIIITTKENAIEKTFDKGFTIRLYFDFFKILVYLSEIREDLIARFELISLERGFCVVEIPQQHRSFQKFF